MQSAPAVGRYQRLELTVPLPGAYHNPFDPDEVALDATFTTPSGRSVRVPGFFFQDFTRARAAEGTEVLTPSGAAVFKVRFAWGEVGEYHYTVDVKDAAGPRRLGEGTFRMEPSSDPGFVRRSRSAPHYLRLDSGASYFPVGENICYPGPAGTYDYDRWLNKLADAGGNYTRLWLASEWQPLALERSAKSPDDGDGLGRYDQRAAWRVDYVLDLARARRARVMLCLDSFTSFTSKEFGCWEQSPYNRANGGPCARPRHFFTDEEARRLFRQRLRYLVARWGADTTVLSWEFWNEVDLVPGYHSDEAAAWHQEMGDYLRAIDPWQHLRTTSFANSAGDAAVDALPQLDLVQTHSYWPGDVVAAIASFTNRKLARFDKPHYFGEFGIDPTPGRYPTDPTGLHLHDALWASLLSGSAGTAMAWWWDNYVDARDLYHHFTGVSAFAAGVPWVQENYAPREPARVQFPAGTPGYVTLDLRPRAESWKDNAESNLPHTYEVRNDGTIVGGETLSRVVHGTGLHPKWHNPTTLLVTYPEPGRFEVSVTAVSGYGGAALTISLDGKETLRVPFADTKPENPDTLYQYDGVYGIDVPAGPHTLVVDNPGPDWFTLEYRLTHYATVPNLRVLALANTTSALVWAQNREHSWWHAKCGVVPTPQPPAEIALPGFTPGTYSVAQWGTDAGKVTSTRTVSCADGTITLTTPADLTTDVAWKVRKE